MRLPVVLLALLAMERRGAVAQDASILVLRPIEGSAAVFVDGTFRDSLGQKPLPIPIPTLGRHEVLVRAGDGRQFRTTVIMTGKPEYLTVKLTAPPPPLPPPAERLASLEFSVRPDTVAVQDTVVIGLVLRGHRGNTLALASQPAPRIINHAPAVVAVRRSQDSLQLVALTRGMARVEVRIGPVVGSVRFWVTEAPQEPPTPPAADTDSMTRDLRLVALEDSVLHLVPGEPARLHVVAQRPDGGEVPVPLRFASYGPQIAGVDTLTGEVWGRAPGRTAIRVRALDRPLQADFPVVVEEPGLSLPYDTLYLMQGGEEVLGVRVGSRDGRLYRGPVRWASDSESTAQFVGTTGVVFGKRPGAARLTAEVAGAVLSMHTRVFPPFDQYLSMRTERDTIVLPIGDTLQLWVQGLTKDSGGRVVIPRAPMTWSIVGSAAAVVQGQPAVLQGTHEGTTTLVGRPLIHKNSPPREFQWTIRVIGSQLHLDRDHLGMRVGSIDSLRAFLVGPSGARLPAENLSWQSSAPSFVSTRGQGVLQAMQPGRATITATTPWDSTASATVLVAPDVVYHFARRDPTAGLIAGVRGRAMNGGPAVDLRLAGGTISAPAVSPDHTRLAYVVRPVAGASELWISDIDGQSPSRLPTRGGEADMPAWSPDGTSLYFLLRSGGRGRVYRATIASGRTVPITDSARAVHSFAIDPARSRLVFAALNGEHYSLYQLALGEGLPAAGAVPGPLLPGVRISSTQPRIAAGDQYFFLQVVDASKGTKAVMRVVGGGPPERVSPSTMVISDFAVAPSGGELLLQVIETAQSGRSRRVLYWLRLQGTAAPVPTLYDALQDGDLGTPSFAP